MGKLGGWRHVLGQSVTIPPEVSTLSGHGGVASLIQ